MAVPQTANSNDITSVIANLSTRQIGRPKTKITGRKRAAILMLALGEQYGGKIWSMLDDDEVKDLSIAMSTLGTVEADVVEDMLLEFVSRMSASGALMGNFDATERLLQQYLPAERVVGIMDEIRGPAGRNMWEKLSNVQEEVLANYLKNEYPQTIAVVLSKLRPEHAARVLAILPEDMALDVVNRMLRMEAVQKEVIERVEQTLRTEFMSNLSQTRRRDAHEVMAEIFNNFDRQTETRFLTTLEEQNRESAERIKQLMFTFDDLVKLDTGSVADAPRRQGQARHRAQGRDRLGAPVFPGQHVDARRQDAGGRDEGDRPGAAARRGRGAGAARQPRQGPRRQGRDHDLEEPRRRGAGLLSARAKFMFDVDFAAGAEPARRTITPTVHEAALAEARATAYRDGVAAALAQSEARAAVALERIAAGLDALARQLAAIEARLEAEAVEVAVAVARKLAPELIAREPLAEIAALARGC